MCIFPPLGKRCDCLVCGAWSALLVYGYNGILPDMFSTSGFLFCALFLCKNASRETHVGIFSLGFWIHFFRTCQFCQFLSHRVFHLLFHFSATPVHFLCVSSVLVLTPSDQFWSLRKPLSVASNVEFAISVLLAWHLLPWCVLISTSSDKGFQCRFKPICEAHFIINKKIKNEGSLSCIITVPFQQESTNL